MTPDPDADLYLREALARRGHTQAAAPITRDRARLVWRFVGWLLRKPPHWEGIVVLRFGRGGSLEILEAGPVYDIEKGE
jgi:hypothetical protein